MTEEGFVYTVPTSRSRKTFRLTLTESGIEWLGEGDEVKKTRSLRFEDVISCSCQANPSDSKDNAAYMTIVSYPFTNKGILGKKFMRRRTVTTFGYSLLNTYEENYAKLISQEQVISTRISSAEGHGAEALEKIFPKPILVLINPKSGSGIANRLFTEKVKPMLEEAGIDYQVQETEKAGHGKIIAKDVDLSSIYGIVIMSGDGLTYEVYQGLMARDDWETAVKTPIGVLPGGSGNALCCAVNFSSHEPIVENLILHSSYVLIKHQVKPMDLVALDTQDGRIYSFLSVTWGMIADIDIESERYRTLGSARFTVGAIARILNLRTYKARLSFKPTNKYSRKGRSKTMGNISDDPMNEERTRSATMPTIPSTNAETSHQRTNSGNQLSSSMPTDSSDSYGHSSSVDLNHDSPTLHNEPAPIFDQPMATNTNMTNSVQEEDMTSDPILVRNGAAHSAEGPLTRESLTPLLPPLDEPVPDDWITIDDSFITVAAIYQSHLGADTMCAPSATLDDGDIHLLIVRAPVGRTQLLGIFGQMETGAHISNPSVEMVAVKAFRLEPLTSPGNIAVDGEVISYGSIQGQILPSMARVMSR